MLPLNVRRWEHVSTCWGWRRDRNPDAKSATDVIDVACQGPKAEGEVGSAVTCLDPKISRPHLHRFCSFSALSTTLHPTTGLKQSLTRKPLICGLSKFESSESTSSGNSPTTPFVTSLNRASQDPIDRLWDRRVGRRSKIRIGTKDMRLTGQRNSSPRDPNKFPTTQLFLLGK